MVAGGTTCIKYLLFVFNFTYVLTAVGLLVVGILVREKFDEYSDFFGYQFSAVAILLEIVGGIIFLIAFFGCCGAIRENYTWTMAFAVLLILIFIVELAGGIAVLVMRNSIETEVRTIMVAAEQNYYKHPGVTCTWIQLQQNFHCCGVDSYKDWSSNDNMNDTVPDSCCKKLSLDCGYAPIETHLQDINRDGCLNKTVDWVKDNMHIVGSTGIGLASVQIVGIIFACCLARKIKKQQY